MVDFVISGDLGQSIDYSAVSVLHRRWWRSGQRPEVETAKLWHEVPMMKRWELGTSYLVIVKDIVELYWYVSSIAEFGVGLVVDQGGPGRPVIDMLRNEKVRPVGISITAGEHVYQKDGNYSCPKKDICAALVVAAQKGDLKVSSKLKLADEFSKELSAFGYTINRRTGKVSYESMMNEIHDDLVVSAAMGLWYSTYVLSQMFRGGKGATVEDTEYNPIAQ